MYKSVKAYVDAVKVADEEQKARDAAAQEKYNADVKAAEAARDYTLQDEIRVAYRLDCDASAKLRNAQEAVAWAALAFADEPAVAWIARNCGSYKDHARITLRALKSTSTAEDMRKLARRSSWCGTFDDLLLSAKRAGVFADEVSKERLEMFKWFQNNLSSNTSYLTQLETYMNAVLEAEGPMRAAKLALAQAAEAAPTVAASDAEVPDEETADEPELVAA